MTVAMYDPAALYRSQKTDIDAAILRVLESGKILWGPEGPSFEAEFANWLGATHVVTTGSGSASLRAALRALGIGPGDEVITVANTDLGDSASIRMVGARVRWVDIDPVSRCMDPALVTGAITPATKAIMPVDMYGHPADMIALQAIAKEHGLFLIQDCCLSLGAEIDGQRVGTFADVTCFSFSSGKHLGSFGAGGACATEDAGLADRIRRYVGDGQNQSIHYTHPRQLALHHETDGENARLHELQAAILRVMLPGLSGRLQARRAQARTYSEALADLPLDLPQTKEGCVHAWRNYAVETDDRDALNAHLAARDVTSNALYSPPMHLQPVYKEEGYRAGDLPFTERSCSRILSLPIGPHLKAEQIDEVIAATRSFFA